MTAATKKSTVSEVKPVLVKPKPKIAKFVSFADDCYTDDLENPFPIENQYSYADDEDYFRKLGSFTKSKFSYNTECSSFCASMNSISGTDALLLMNNTSSNTTDFDFIFKSNHERYISDTIPNLTDSPRYINFYSPTTESPAHSKHFSSSAAIAKYIPPSPMMNSSSFFEDDISPVLSPMQTVHHTHSQSLSFSHSVDLFTGSEIRKNSILFYEQWGISPHISQLHRALSPTYGKSMNSKGVNELFMENILESERNVMKNVVDVDEKEMDEECELVVVSKLKKNKKIKWKKAKSVTDGDNKPQEKTETEIREYLRRRSTITGDFIFGT